MARTLARGVVNAKGRDGQRPEFWTQDAGSDRCGTGGDCRDAPVARAKRRLLCAELDRLPRSRAAPQTRELLRLEACVPARTRAGCAKTPWTSRSDQPASHAPRGYLLRVRRDRAGSRASRAGTERRERIRARRRADRCLLDAGPHPAPAT